MTAVLDASVLLACLLDERGGDTLYALGACHVSAINLAEVYTKVMERGGTEGDADIFLKPLPLRVHSLDEAHARIIGRLRVPTRPFGLSLGDRACLALGVTMNLPVLTAERQWRQLDLGIDIRLIR